MAQLVEQLTLNQWVPGSSPGGCTKSRNQTGFGIFSFYTFEIEIRYVPLATMNIWGNKEMRFRDV